MRKETLPCSPGDHPKLYSSPLLFKAQHRIYQHLVGMAEWSIHIRRFDILYALTSLNHFSESLKEIHLIQFVKIFGYCQSVTGGRKSIVVLP